MGVLVEQVLAWDPHVVEAQLGVVDAVQAHLVAHVFNGNSGHHLDSTLAKGNPGSATIRKDLLDVQLGIDTKSRWCSSQGFILPTLLLAILILAGQDRSKTVWREQQPRISYFRADSANRKTTTTNPNWWLN